MIAALPALARGLLIGTAALWFLMELRQGIKRRPEAVKVDRGSVYALRVATLVGAGVAVVASHVVPGAVIRPGVAWS